MCVCNAFTYRSCRREHSKFVLVDVCLAARLGLRERCAARILNGHPDIPRAFPSIDGICAVCFPLEAAREEEEKKEAEEERRRREAEETESRSLPVNLVENVMISPDMLELS